MSGNVMFLSLCQIPFKCLMLRKCPNQGLYGNRKTEFQDFSRTFQEVFFLFSRLNFFPILYIVTQKVFPILGVSSFQDSDLIQLWWDKEGCYFLGTAQSFLH